MNGPNNVSEVTKSFHFAEVPTPFLGGSGGPVLRQERMPSIIGAPADTNAKLDGMRVAIVGLGSVGGRVALHLSRMRVKELLLIDPKPYKAESILTQPIGPELIGANKAASMARLCKAISPGTAVRYFDGSINDVAVADLIGVDIIFLATDNLAAEVETGQRAMHLGVPLIQGSVHGETLVSQVRTYANNDTSGPCPACGFNEAEWAQVHSETKYSCEPDSAGEGGGYNQTQPTFSISSLCSMAADQMIMSFLRQMLPVGLAVADRSIEYCGHTGKTTTTPLIRNPDCVCDHIPWGFQNSDGTLEDSSLDSLARKSETTSGQDESTLFEVEGFDWVGSFECLNGHSLDWNHFHPKAKATGGDPCPSCGEDLFCPPLSRRGAVTFDSLGSAAYKPLSELGVLAPEWVRISTSNATTLIH